MKYIVSSNWITERLLPETMILTHSRSRSGKMDKKGQICLQPSHGCSTSIQRTINKFFEKKKKKRECHNDWMETKRVQIGNKVSKRFKQKARLLSFAAMMSPVWRLVSTFFFPRTSVSQNGRLNNGERNLSSEGMLNGYLWPQGLDNLRFCEGNGERSAAPGRSSICIPSARDG